MHIIGYLNESKPENVSMKESEGRQEVGVKKNPEGEEDRQHIAVRNSLE